LPAPLPLGQLQSITATYEQLTPEAGMFGNALPYVNVLVDLDPVNYPGLLAILVLGTWGSNVNLGQLTTIGPNTYQLIWNAATDLVNTVNDVGMGMMPPAPQTPMPLFGPVPIPYTGMGPPALWLERGRSIANLVIAYPQARLVNGLSGDGGMPKNTPTASMIMVLGDSGSHVQDAVRMLTWTLNGTAI
jgi:hypothetical protein